MTDASAGPDRADGEHSPDERLAMIEGHLAAAVTRVHEGQRARLIADQADAQLGAIEEELRDAQASLDHERADVDQLQTFSARRILAMLKGARGTELEREQAEVEAASGRLAEIVARRTDARKTQAEAHDRLTAYRNAAHDLTLVLSAKEGLLLRRGGSLGQRLTDLARERGALIAHVRELEEAMSAGWVVLRTIDQLLDQLSSAHAWSNYDTFLGGGLIASMVKHDRMDSASDLSRSVDSQLRAFRRELGDVRVGLQTDTLELSPGTRFVDAWFDNIFTDLSVGSRISAANESANHVRRAVATAIQLCQDRLNEASARQVRLADERSKLVVQAPVGAP